MEIVGTLSSGGVAKGNLSTVFGKNGYTPIKGVDYFTEEDITEIVEKAVEKITSSVTGRIAYITLYANQWENTESPYAQSVIIDGTTENSKVDLNPTVEQLSIFHNKDIAFVTENENGTITVYCIGQKPTNDYTMQITITEVVSNG